jgi:hypothetical protein
LIRTDSKVITQHHFKQEALELMGLFTYLDEKGELIPEFPKSNLIASKIMETVVKFYVDVEYAG